MQRTNAKKQSRITSGSVLSGMLFFAIPLILSSILNRLFNTADTLMVGRWGGDTVEECEHALAAVGSCGALIGAITALFSGLASGTSLVLSRQLGAKDEEGIKQTVSTSFCLSLVSGLICMCIGVCFAKPLLTAMGTDASLLNTAAAYMRVYYIGIPATLTYSFCAAMLTATGDTVRPLMFLTLGGIVNVLLNALMIMVFRMGAVGVGLATAITQYVFLIMILIYMSRADIVCRIPWRRLRIHKQPLTEILRISIPAGLQGTLIASSNVVAQASINAYGPAFIAGSTAAANIETYLAVLHSGISQAGAVFVGQNVGAKNFARVKRSLYIGVALTVGIGFSTGLISCLAAEPIVGLFCPNNAAAIQAGVLRARVLLLVHFVYGMMVFGMSALRGMGKSILPTALMLMGCGAFRILWLTVYQTFFNGNPVVLFLVYPVSWILTASAVYLSVLIVYRRVARANADETEMG